MTAVLHPLFDAIKQTALAWATPQQAEAQARVIVNELIENGFVPDGQVVGGMPVRNDYQGRDE